MPMTLAQTFTAINLNLTSQFAAAGGTGGVTYSVNAGGAGGTIGASTGIYTAPSSFPSDPTLVVDTITATDSASPPNTATATVLIAGPLRLLFDIFITQLGIAQDHISFWDQKEFMPTDENMFIIIALANRKHFSNNRVPAGAVTGTGPGWDQVTQYTNIQDNLNIHIVSSSTQALFGSPQVLLALGSAYSELQQEYNSFKIARLPTACTDISGVDGARIPYHFVFNINLLYAVSLKTPNSYFSTFGKPQIIVDP